MSWNGNQKPYVQFGFTVVFTGITLADSDVVTDAAFIGAPAMWFSGDTFEVDGSAGAATISVPFSAEGLRHGSLCYHVWQNATAGNAAVTLRIAMPALGLA